MLESSTISGERQKGVSLALPSGFVRQNRRLKLVKIEFFIPRSHHPVPIDQYKAHMHRKFELLTV
jgi:hypothetical protein